jgi:hypothetical protein
MDVERASSSDAEHQVGLTLSEITSLFRSKGGLADEFFEHQHRRIFLEGEKRLMFAILEDDYQQSENPGFVSDHQTVPRRRVRSFLQRRTITSWLLLTPDIQVVRGAQREKFTTGYRSVTTALHRQPQKHRDGNDPGPAIADRVQVYQVRVGPRSNIRVLNRRL